MTIKAKYAGKCWGCGGTVALGEACAMVMFGGKKKIAHLRCEAAALAKPGVTRPALRVVKPPAPAVPLRANQRLVLTPKAAYVLDIEGSLAHVERTINELLELKAKLLVARQNPVMLS